MKHFTFIILVVIIVGCKQTASEKISVTENNTDDTTIINMKIIDHYRKEFQKDTVDQPKAKFEIDTRVSGIHLQLIPDTTFVSDRSYNTIPFSVKFLKGDLNGDKIDDIIVPVYSAWGISYESHDLFVFISEKAKFDSFKIYSSYDLAQCEGEGSFAGQFYPEKIINGTLLGEIGCYTESDPHCCPSIKTKAAYKFDEKQGFVLSEETK